jgi:hypothetical protein
MIQKLNAGNPLTHIGITTKNMNPNINVVVTNETPVSVNLDNRWEYEFEPCIMDVGNSFNFEELKKQFEKRQESGWEFVPTVPFRGTSHEGPNEDTGTYLLWRKARKN